MAEKTIVVDFDINAEDIKAANDAMAKSRKETEAYQKQLNALKLQQKELNALYKVGAVDANEYAKQQTEIKNKTAEVNKGMRESNKTFQNNKTVIDAAKGSNDQLRARLSLLTKEYNGLSKEQRENSKEGQKMGATIKTITDKLKANEKAVGDNRRNVGNYKDSIIEAAKASGSFGSGLVGMASGMKKATIASLQFLATPIGAVIGAIGVAIGLVVGGFKLLTASLNRTEDGSAALAGVMNVFKGVMSGVLNVVEPIALFLVEGLADGFEKLGNVVANVSEKIQSALKFIGLDGTADGLAKLGNSIKESSAATSQLAKAEAELNKIQRQQGIIQLEYQNRAEKLRQIRDDESRSIKDRIKANKDLGDVLTQQSNTEMALAKRSLEIANLRIKADGANTENLDKKAEAELKIAEIEERITSQRSEQMTNENSLIREGAAIKKQAHAEYVKQENEKRKLTEEQIKAEKKAEEERAKIREDFRREQLGELERRKEDAFNKANELRAASVDEIEIQAFLSQELIEIDRAEKDTKLKNTIQYFEDEAELARAKIRKEIDDADLRKAALMLVDQELLEAKQQTYDLEANQYQASIDGLAIIDEERQADILAQKAEVDAQLVELDRQKTEAIKAHLEEVDAKQKQVQQDSIQATQAGLSAVGGMLTGLGDIMNENIRQTEEQAKAAGKTDKQIREQTKAAKQEAHGLAVAAAIVQTLQAGIAAYQSGASVPIVGVALGPVMAAAALAFGFAQVAQMKSTKFARGGVLKGPSHSQGGIPISVDGVGGYEAEGDEIVLTKGVYRNPALRAKASQLNQLGGGAPLASGTHFAAGGVLQSTGAIRAASQDGNAAMTQQLNNLGDRIQNMQTVVSVSDIERVSNQKRKVQVTADL